MPETVRFTLERSSDPRLGLEQLLRSRWTRDLSVSEVPGKATYEKEFEIRATGVDMLVDGRTGARTFLVATSPVLGTFTGALKQKGWVIGGPSRSALFAELARHTTSTIQKSENALLRVAHARLVQIPVVQVALSPIRSIVGFIDLHGEVDQKELLGLKKTPEQLERYVTLLTDLKVHPA